MKANFQLIDCDYVVVDNTPIVRVFGKTEAGKSICTFYEGYNPYFYIVPKDKDSITKHLNKEFKQLVTDIAETERLLPIGFTTNKTKLLKITATDPSQVPLIRDSLLTHGLVNNVYEADILFKNRFMADMGLNGMDWYEVTGDSIGTNTVKTEVLIKAKEFKKIHAKKNMEFQYMCIDIEIGMAVEGIPNATKDPISMISLSFYPEFRDKKSLVLVSKHVEKTGDVLSFKDEKNMLEGFLKVLDSFDPDFITGYNINGFDMPYILTRLSENKLPRALGRDKNKQSISRKFGIKSRTSLVGRVVVDVYELVKESIGKGILRLKRYGLGDVSRELLGMDKVDISHGEISKHWNGTKEQLEKLINYARVDSVLALKLLLDKNMVDKFIELSKVSGLLLQDALDGGEGTRVENILLREFNREGYVLPTKPSTSEILKRRLQKESKGLKGALVLDPKIGLQTNCVVYLDFKSMYPSIFISYNICPTTLCIADVDAETVETPDHTKFVSTNVRAGIIPRIVRKLIQERDVVRSQMKAESNIAIKRILDAKQLALKYVTNSFYGYTGYVLARVYLLEIANAITSCGRYLIQVTKNTAEMGNEYTVIYGDTDSIMVDTKVSDTDKAMEIGKKIEIEINNRLKGIVEVKIENIFKSLLILAKKRYAGISIEQSNGEVKESIVMKGIETVRRDWCDLTSETLFSALEIILKEQSPKKAVEYVKGILSKLERNEIPIEKLVITKSISKPLRDYKGVQPHIEVVKKIRKRNPTEAPGIGDRVGFVIIHGPQLMSERAEDPNYVEQHGLKIDSKYYIESQILPPLERVFDAIGITKSEVIGIGKQLMLFDAFKNKNPKPVSATLPSAEGFICKDCNQSYRRIPLIGKCDSCNGEILFYYAGQKGTSLG